MWKDNAWQQQNADDYINDIVNDAISRQSFTVYGNTPIGGIALYAGATEPDSWLICDGRLVNIAEYPELYEVIGQRFKTDG